METKKLEVLTKLYSNMQQVFMDGCYGMNYSNYSEQLRESLKKAEELKLKWEDFYLLHQQKIENGLIDALNSLEREGLKDQILKNVDGKLRVGSPRNYIDFDSKTTIFEVYEKLFKQEQGEIEKYEMNKIFPENKFIGPEDFSKASNYFRDNIKGKD